MMKLFLDVNRFVDTELGIDISIPLRAGEENVNAWYCEPVRIDPVVAGDFIGDVNQGGSVNFKNITLNAHGNGTHTECVGHISKENYTINQCLKEFHFLADLITVTPEKISNDEFEMIDEIIDANLLPDKLSDNTKALIIRTSPNTDFKINRHYSGTNPAYFSLEAIKKINDLGVKHLCVDLPSIDRENDGGKVLGHKMFWNYPKNPETGKTITEMIYVPNSVQDGHYFLSIQIMSLESDASPSKIILYEIQKKE